MSGGPGKSKPLPGRIPIRGPTLIPVLILILTPEPIPTRVLTLIPERIRTPGLIQIPEQTRIPALNRILEQIRIRGRTLTPILNPSPVCTPTSPNWTLGEGTNTV